MGEEVEEGKRRLGKREKSEEVREERKQRKQSLPCSLPSTRISRTNSRYRNERLYSRCINSLILFSERKKKITSAFLFEEISIFLCFLTLSLPSLPSSSLPFFSLPFLPLSFVSFMQYSRRGKKKKNKRPSTFYELWNKVEEGRDANLWLLRAVRVRRRPNINKDSRIVEDGDRKSIRPAKREKERDQIFSASDVDQLSQTSSGAKCQAAAYRVLWDKYLLETHGWFVLYRKKES